MLRNDLARRSQPNFLIPDTRGTIFLATVQQSSLLSRFLTANPRLRNRKEDRNATHHAFFFSPLSMFSRRDDRTRIALNEAWDGGEPYSLAEQQFLQRETYSQRTAKRESSDLFRLVPFFEITYRPYVYRVNGISVVSQFF